MQKEYREHRRNILVERTISQLQEYYPQAVALSQQRKDHQAINKIHAEIDELNKQIHSKYRQISAIRDKTYESGERRKFVMPCQTTNCKGMLSSAYKCDLCEKYTCSKCFESIDGDKDAHICNPDNVETAEEIKKNTRPCPSCGCRISKIDGCDQMWCVECKTAFSWSKGTVEVGQVHNPHYFQWMRQNGGMPRTDQMPGAGCNDNQMHSAFIRDLFDMLYRMSLLEDAFISNCRNCNYSLDEMRTILPSVYNVYNTILSTMHSDSELLKTKRGIPNDFFVNFYRFIVHTDQITFRDLNRKIRIRNGDNTPILHYILGEETRDNLSEYLVKRDIVNARDGAHRDILEAFIMVGKQIISDMYNELSGIEMEFSWRIISDQIKYMRIGSLTDTKDANTSKMMEFSRFYTQYYLPHKENIEKLYRLCGNISNKYKHSINSYSAYSNLEIIKYLLLYNSKKQVEMWNPDVNNFHVYRFDNKESLIQSMNHFKNQMEKYSRQELKN